MNDQRQEGAAVGAATAPDAQASSLMKGALTVRDLTLARGSRTLVAGLGQGFLPGQIWCIAGPNGAGKTTLLESLAGLRQASTVVHSLYGQQRRLRGGGHGCRKPSKIYLAPVYWKSCYWVVILTLWVGVGRRLKTTWPRGRHSIYSV